MQFNFLSASFIILIVTVGLSILAFRNVSYYEKWVFKPYDVYRKKNVINLIMSGFIHADWVHLLVNMFTFFNFAYVLERAVGSIQFLIIYFGSMVVCEVGTLVRFKDNYYYRSLGASGAVCGMLFSYILFYPMNKIFIFPIPIPIPSFIWAFLFLIYSAYASKRNNDHINHDAHLWGAVSGFLITIILNPSVLVHFLDKLW